MSSPGVHALSSLRDLLQQQQLPVFAQDNQHIQIGSSLFPAKLHTPYKSKKGEFYELDAICFLLTHEQLKLAAYITECSKQGIVNIPFGERKSLLDFLRSSTPLAANYDVVAYEKWHAERAPKRSATTAALGVVEPAAKKHQSTPIAQWGIDDVVREERANQDRGSVLQVQNKSFKNILDIFLKAQSSNAKVPSGSVSSSAPAGAAVPSKAAAASTTPNTHVPIIVVPAAVSSVISMYNVREFLENGSFRPGDDIRQSGAKKADEIMLSRASYSDKHKTVKFQIIDNVSKLKDSDWPRVVAVFVQGATWQFTDWPKKLFPNIPAIFENVCAFHLYFDDEPLHNNITNWRTHRLPISKRNRYSDRSVVMDFWHTLIEFILARNTVKKLNI